MVNNYVAYDNCLLHKPINQSSMLCYQDRTYCSSDVEVHTCGRELSKDEAEHAKKVGLPIAYGSFCVTKK